MGKGASMGLSLHSCWSYTSTEYVVKHREEEGWRLTFSGHVPDNQCFFPSMCPQLSWVHRSFHQPQIFFSFASGWRDLLSHYFTTSLVTAETNRISILTQSWWISQGYSMGCSMGCYPNGLLVPVPNALRWELHEEHQKPGEFFTLNTIPLKSWGKNSLWFHPLWDWSYSGGTNYSLKPMGRTVITWAHGLASDVGTALDWLKQLLFTLSPSADHSRLPTASRAAPAQLFV